VATLAESPYQAALLDKLREEVDEPIAAHTTHALIEEAADIVEVPIAIASERGVTLDSILDGAQRRHAEGGGFGTRL
jgi:predicted house-cleaning noncanonical NTP pyrophosphatase (MazG superfamily)